MVRKELSDVLKHEIFRSGSVLRSTFFTILSLLLAVLLAVLVAAVAVLGWSEGRGALAALGAVGVYYCVLWLFRHKIEHTIHFSITKHY